MSMPSLLKFVRIEVALIKESGASLPRSSLYELKLFAIMPALSLIVNVSLVMNVPIVDTIISLTFTETTPNFAVVFNNTVAQLETIMINIIIKKNFF